MPPEDWPNSRLYTKATMQENWNPWELFLTAASWTVRSEQIISSCVNWRHLSRNWWMQQKIPFPPLLKQWNLCVRRWLFSVISLGISAKARVAFPNMLMPQILFWNAMRSWNRKSEKRAVSRNPFALKRKVPPFLMSKSRWSYLSALQN